MFKLIFEIKDWDDEQSSEETVQYKKNNVIC